MKTVLVTGACGLLGQHLVYRLKNDFVVIAVDIAENIFNEDGGIKFLQSDLSIPNNVSNIINEYSPKAVYNCASYNDVDACEREREKAFRVNVGIVEGLLESGAERIVHFSTDYVFNGNAGPYAEDDETGPVGYYGVTKLASEKAILDSGTNHLVIRTNVLFGKGEKVRPNFIGWIIDRLNDGVPIRVVTDQFGNPTLVDNLAEASIEAEKKQISGILNVAGDSYLSRYDIAVKTASYFGLDSSLIAPASTSELGQKAKRPLRGGLKIEKARKLLSCRLLKFEEALSYL